MLYIVTFSALEQYLFMKENNTFLKENNETQNFNKNLTISLAIKNFPEKYNFKIIYALHQPVNK